MKIDHLAIWVTDLEKMKSFYGTYFGLLPGNRYHNPVKDFTSYFLSFPEGPRLELMHKPSVARALGALDVEHPGLTHFAISVGDKATVDAMTEQLRQDGYQVVGEPRTTGDGYYESVVFDPEHNRIKITI